MRIMVMITLQQIIKLTKETEFKVPFHLTKGLILNKIYIPSKINTLNRTNTLNKVIDLNF